MSNTGCQCKIDSDNAPIRQGIKKMVKKPIHIFLAGMMLLLFVSAANGGELELSLIHI